MNGILLVNKPLFYTSHDVVDVIRRVADTRRVGHAGTLDPMATGLLVILLGQATRLFNRFSSDDKLYEAVMTLGLKTDTQDLEGKILQERPVESMEAFRIEEAFKRFIGVRQQLVPRYSSVKIAGKPSHRLARRNVAFEQPTKSIEIKSLSICEVALPDIHFMAHVSKGTYLRTLCEELGEALGNAATLSGLRRIRSGSFSLSESLSLTEIQTMTSSALRAALIPLEHHIATA